MASLIIKWCLRLFDNVRKEKSRDKCRNPRYRRKRLAKHDRKLITLFCACLMRSILKWVLFLTPQLLSSDSDDEIVFSDTLSDSESSVKSKPKSRKAKENIATHVLQVFHQEFAFLYFTVSGHTS